MGLCIGSYEAFVPIADSIAFFAYVVCVRVRGLRGVRGAGPCIRKSLGKKDLVFDVTETRLAEFFMGWYWSDYYVSTP